MALNPGSLPLHFQQRLASPPGSVSMPADICLNRASTVIKRRIGGVPVTIAVPTNAFDGVMARIVPVDAPGLVTASLILKHPDEALSITLVETHAPEDLATLWTQWAKVLNLPMLVCDLGGKVKPIEAYQAAPSARPAPRRRMRLLTGRRPRFLNRRHTGRSCSRLPSFQNEREIIART